MGMKVPRLENDESKQQKIQISAWIRSSFLAVPLGSISRPQTIQEN